MPVDIVKGGCGPVREFTSGATRNDASNKFDYEGFINPEVLHAYGSYMHEHCHQRDGSVRDADNWQKGIPFRVYVKSLVRHTIDLWRMERGAVVINPDSGKPHTKQELCCAIMFNAMGYLKEELQTSEVNYAAKGCEAPNVLREEELPRPARRGEKGCSSQQPTGLTRLLCERPTGHPGKHMAWGDYAKGQLYPGGEW